MSDYDMAKLFKTAYCCWCDEGGPGDDSAFDLWVNGDDEYSRLAKKIVAILEKEEKP